MNNKKSKAFLLIAVVAIWGIITLKIVNGLSTKDQIVSPNLLIHSNGIDTSETNENIHLFLNYPDPFLDEFSADIDSSSKTDPTTISQGLEASNTPTANPETGSKIPDIYNFVSYAGMILNVTAKQKIGILKINDSSIIVKEKSKVKGITIVRIHPDAVTLKYNGKLYSIPKQ